MAINKLIKPTNVTVQIPAFTDQPDNRVNTNCIDKAIDGINALSDQMVKVAKKVVTFTNGVGTVPDFNTTNHILLSAEGAGFIALVFDGNDGDWHATAVNGTTLAVITNLNANRELTICYKNK